MFTTVFVLFLVISINGPFPVGNAVTYHMRTGYTYHSHMQSPTTEFSETHKSAT